MEREKDKKQAILGCVCVFIHRKQNEREKKRKKKKGRPSSSRQLCTHCVCLLQPTSIDVCSHSERANAREKISERGRERDGCSMSRLSFNYTVCSFVLFAFFSLSLSLACSLALFPPTFHKAMENGTRLSFLVSLPLIRLVIYDGGRHPIEIARRNAYTHGRSSLFLSRRTR